MWIFVEFRHVFTKILNFNRFYTVLSHSRASQYGPAEGKKHYIRWSQIWLLTRYEIVVVVFVCSCLQKSSGARFGAPRRSSCIQTPCRRVSEQTDRRVGSDYGS